MVLLVDQGSIGVITEQDVADVSHVTGSSYVKILVIGLEVSTKGCFQPAKLRCHQLCRGI